MVVWPRSLTSWDPWREMRRLEREMNSLFGGVATPAAREWPVMRVHGNERGLQLQALVPGFTMADLELTVCGTLLSLRGKRQAEAAHELREFERSITLPFPIEAEKVKAVVKDGVLDVELPRAAAQTPRRIPVQSQ